MSDFDQIAVNTIRLLSADMVQAANSGHPGAPMGCAPMAHALFGYCMNFNPEDATWWNRDRFVLSNGHACALLYSMLHLCGYEGITVEELKKFRQLGSKTPGHPERHVTPGVEVTTGPLGQGISNAVGLALAQSHMASSFGESIFNNYTFVICGDGCLQEGVSSEASSLAGHWGLGRLIVLYDDNRITIDGATHLSFTEDVGARYRSYGWEVLDVNDGDHDVSGIVQAVLKAKSNLTQPTLIKVSTTIGFGSKKQGSEKIHGSPLGIQDLMETKTKFGFNPHESFMVPEEVACFYRKRRAHGERMAHEWGTKLELLHPSIVSDLKRRFSGALPESAFSGITSTFDGEKATRSTSGDILSAMMKSIPELIGGSADLMESTLCNKANLPAYSKSNPENRIIHFGVREHGMCAIANGISAYGGLLPFVSTFANFIGYCWGSLRLSALSQHQILFVASHDSIDLGEDGPTHQPVEILPLIRATPNVVDFRPADGRECLGGMKAFASHTHGPTILVLNRSNIPQLANSSAEKCLSGAYILEDFPHESNQVILAGSGTEVQLLILARSDLAAKGVHARVVSMPSWKLFEDQSNQYKQSVFPAGIPVLITEASRIPALRFTGASIQMHSFGASAPAKALREHFGFTVENVVQKASSLLTHNRE